FLGKITDQYSNICELLISIILFGLFWYLNDFDGYNMKQDMNVDLKQMEKIIENEIANQEKNDDDDQISPTTLYSMSIKYNSHYQLNRDGGLQWAVGFGSFFGNFLQILLQFYVQQLFQKLFPFEQYK
ncbi:hypothetical protein DERP_011670, partial [Dermatophagoides pteronyssinus]